MKYSDTSGRYALLDELRGLDLVSMMLYHGCWDLVNLFGIQADWYYGLPGHLWQQSICWVFILLSGFCAQLGHHTLRRGAQVFGAGALVTAVTLLFMPEDRVIWVLEACAFGCRRHCMQTALQRTLAFIRGGSILRIILPFCRGCFCSGRGTFSTTL